MFGGSRSHTPGRASVCLHRCVAVSPCLCDVCVGAERKVESCRCRGCCKEKDSPSVFKMPPGQAQRQDVQVRIPLGPSLPNMAFHSHGNEAKRSPKGAEATSRPPAGFCLEPPPGLLLGDRTPPWKRQRGYLRENGPPKSLFSMKTMSRTDFSRALEMGQKLATTLRVFIQEKWLIL